MGIVKKEKNKILGLFLAIGESFADFARKGQDKLLIEQNFSYYSKAFWRVYVFSYEKEERFLLNNVRLFANRWRLSRYFYSLILPFFYKDRLKQCHVFRGLQLTGGIPGIIASKIYGKPLVINYGYRYQKQALREGKLIQALLYWLIEPVILSQASRIIVTTKYLERELKKRYKNKLVYIPNGVDIEKFKPCLKRKQGEKRQIMFVGRLEKSKNLKNLIDAIALLAIKDKIELMFIGSGSQKEELKNYANERRVSLEIKGVVPHDELPKYLNKADIFILPSLAEGHPKALLEAMVCGLPVVGTEVIGIKEIIEDGENGVLCKTNPQSIARAIERILNEAELSNKLRKNARRYVIKNFSLEKTMAKEVELLHSLS